MGKRAQRRARNRIDERECEPEQAIRKTIHRRSRRADQGRYESDIHVRCNMSYDATQKDRKARRYQVSQFAPLECRFGEIKLKPDTDCTSGGESGAYQCSRKGAHPEGDDSKTFPQEYDGAD